MEDKDLMSRTLKVERLYSLGDYKNIKFTSELYDIPKEFAFNNEIMSRISYVLLLDVEANFRKYVELVGKISTLKVEEMMQYLDEERINTLDEIRKLLN